jgi:hypothetical protein
MEEAVLCVQCPWEGPGITDVGLLLLFLPISYQMVKGKQVIECISLQNYVNMHWVSDSGVRQ